MSTTSKRIAMWSGPRNISTAMMRSFGNRPDTFVCDEPFYAHYLKVTKLDHPGADEVITRHESDWRQVVNTLLAPLPAGKTIFYQKHMTHHLLPNINRDWMSHPELVHVFLIRDPKAMLISLDKVLPKINLQDTGLPQQVEIFNLMRNNTGKTPTVIDSKDILNNPRRALSALCNDIGIAFDEAMLNWPPGPRDTDGTWAKWWYSSVNQSTGFSPYQQKNETLPEKLRDICKQCIALYNQLHDHRLRV